LDDEGKLLCPCADPKCRSPYDLTQVASHQPKGDDVPNYFGELVALQKDRSIAEARKNIEKEADERVQREVEKAKHMSAIELEVDRLRKQIVDDILTPKCPRCKLAYFDFEGCFALTCLANNCKAAFCAWCEEDCGVDAHRHVVNCRYNFMPKKEVFGDHKVLEDARRYRYTEKIERLVRDKPRDVVRPLKEAIKTELANVGMKPEGIRWPN
jgi:hypothetical protein